MGEKLEGEMVDDYNEVCHRIRNLLAIHVDIRKREKLAFTLIRMLLDELDRTRERDFICNIQPLESLLETLNSGNSGHKKV